MKGDFFDKIDATWEPAWGCFGLSQFPDLLHFSLPSPPSRWEYTFISAKILNLPVSDSPKANLNIETWKIFQNSQKLQTILNYEVAENELIW